MLKKHYFLFAALVVYQRDKLERTNRSTSSSPRTDRSSPVRSLAVPSSRHRSSSSPSSIEQKATITDVFMQSVSYLGYMDEKTFHGEFYVEPEDRSAPAPAAANDQKPECPRTPSSLKAGWSAGQRLRRCGRHRPP